MICNICGCSEFVDYLDQGTIQCAECKSNDRHRVLKMYFEKYIKIKPGMKVLHFAPEKFVFDYISEILGSGYSPYDLDSYKYVNYKNNGVLVKKFDLCNDLLGLHSCTYDLIMHNHVLEHLPCDIAPIIYELHRVLKVNGIHLFSIPIMEGKCEDGQSISCKHERRKLFGQADHLRKFGKEDIVSYFSFIKDLEIKMDSSLSDLFLKKDLERYNIPKWRWFSFNGASLLMLKKHDLCYVEK